MLVKFPWLGMTGLRIKLPNLPSALRVKGDHAV